MGNLLTGSDIVKQPALMRAERDQGRRIIPPLFF